MRILLVSRSPRKLFEKAASIIRSMEARKVGYIAVSLRYDGVVIEIGDEKTLNTLLDTLRSDPESAKLIRSIRRMRQ